MKDAVWSDLHHGIQKDGRGAVKRVTNVESVATSIHNILGTRKGERPMRHSFASGLGSVLYEPCTAETMERIAKGVKLAIETWDDRVSVTEVGVEADPDRNTMSARIQYRVVGQSGNFSTLVPLK